MRLEPSLSPSARIWGVIEDGAGLVISCAPCGHQEDLAPQAIKTRFSGREWLTLGALAPRLRCERCGSRDGELLLNQALHAAVKAGGQAG